MNPLSNPAHLHALLAGDADADVGRLDHGDVVGAVADGERVHLELLLDDAHDVRLLQRRRPAAQHGAAVRRQLQEQVLELYGRIPSTFYDFFTH